MIEPNSRGQLGLFLLHRLTPIQGIPALGLPLSGYGCRKPNPGFARFWPSGLPSSGLWPKGPARSACGHAYERQALVIIVILTTMVRGTSTVFNGSAVVVVFAIFHLPHAGGAITMLALIVIR